MACGGGLGDGGGGDGDGDNYDGGGNSNRFVFGFVWFCSISVTNTRKLCWNESRFVDLRECVSTEIHVLQDKV